MTYKKASAEVVKFDNMAEFMLASKESVLRNACNGYTGNPGKFTCNSFGGYGPGNPPDSHSEVELLDGEHIYAFDYHGNHWTCVQF